MSAERPTPDRGPLPHTIDRASGDRDIDAIIALLVATDLLHQPFDRGQIRQGEPRAADRAEIERGLADPEMRAIVCRVADAVAGFARMQIRTTRGNRLYRPLKIALVHEVAVAQCYRGCGIGRSLMHSLHELARGEGVERMQLEHYSDNGAAAALYDAFGYASMRVVRVKDL